LCPATFVELSADQERCAVGALAELLVPLLGDPAATSPDPDRLTDVATLGDTSTEIIPAGMPSV
jgi:hypothetical protein